MTFIASIGAIVRVTPWDELQVSHSDETWEFVDDRTPFDFRVEGRLEDGQIFYGLFGPVVSGPDRYRDLICNIMVRGDGSDWRCETVCQALFKVGPSKVIRCHCEDFRHPDGTSIQGFPRISRFGEIRVVSSE